MNINIGILGYGNIGRGVETALRDNPDMELAAVFTRRDPSQVKILSENVPVISVSEIEAWKDKIDVLLLCGGSATDLPQQTPFYAKMFNVVDTFDTHAKVPAHLPLSIGLQKKMERLPLFPSAGIRDFFSLAALWECDSSRRENYTFWGKGVSQGHSDAIRRIKGVKNAKQYTCPVESAMRAVRNGENPELTTREKHIRECFVVLEDGADAAYVEKQIKTMPNYFADYHTVVHFISEEEFDRNHQGLAHGGFVFRSGNTGKEKEHKHIIEFSLKLDSNPEFTTHVMAAYARAAARMAREGQTGCKTVFDIPPAYLSEKSGEELRSSML